MLARGLDQKAMLVDARSGRCSLPLLISLMDSSTLPSSMVLDLALATTWAHTTEAQGISLVWCNLLNLTCVVEELRLLHHAHCCYSVG